MGFKFILTIKAEKDLHGIDKKQVKIILRKLLWYAKQDQPLRYCIKIQDSHTGDIRFRIGDYRAIAVLDEEKQLILIVKINHRKDVYR